MKTTHSVILLVASLSLLSACTNWNANDNKKVICNKLKSDLVFSGATSITRQADIERSEAPLQQHMYNSNDCDQS